MKFSLTAVVALTFAASTTAWQAKFPASGLVKRMPGQPEPVHISQADLPREAYVRGMDLGTRPVYGISQDHVYDKKMSYDQGHYSKQQPLNSNVGFNSAGMQNFANQASQNVDNSQLRTAMDLGTRPMNGISPDHVPDNRMYFDQPLYSKQQKTLGSAAPNQPAQPNQEMVAGSGMPAGVWTDLGTRPPNGISPDHVPDNRMYFDQPLYSKQQKVLGASTPNQPAPANKAMVAGSGMSAGVWTDLGTRPPNGISPDHIPDHKMSFDQPLYSKQQKTLGTAVRNPGIGQ